MKRPLINPTPKQLDALPAGYYWVENRGFDLKTGKDRPVHRILLLIEIKDRGPERWEEGFFWHDHWYEAGVYIEDNRFLRKFSSYIDGWEDVKIEPVKPASFMS